jgi:hypothetical protein
MDLALFAEGDRDMGILRRLRQTRAVIHEYLGIGWYWVNGYI